ncbi:unnamed protein product [Cyclocybe aegerita]|uniref:Mur ligase n=1 Tax=Cyclocybe aegerita TaxID=1973307 RepID=A0A8S0XFU4_CYCAE|nr:unnamed protein product [Cyclocybe aegerita]
MSIDLSLDRLERLVSHLPPYTRPTLHIAGTNGKGSVSALLTSILRASAPPLRVGRYNSPHLVSIYDCITLDDVPVSPEVYASARAEIEEADAKHGTKLSSFELLTLAALRVFEKERVDVVVLEVGMGGRLDATNIVPDNAIAVSALAAVDLDHQFFLGETVELIAREKAGIGRAGRPFVLGKQRHSSVEGEVKNVLDTFNAALVRALDVKKVDWDEQRDGPKTSPFSLSFEAATATAFGKPAPQPVVVDLPCFSSPVRALLPLYGAHQLDNLGTALTVINSLLTLSPLSNDASLNFKKRITAGTVAEGVKKVSWPGRLSFHTLQVSIPSPPASTSAPILPSNLKQKKYRLVVLADGAHNPASAETLGAYVTHLLDLALASSPTSIRTVNLTYILSLSHSPPKTPLQTLSPILPPKIPSSLASSNMGVNISVAVLRFSPPEGMPWVKSVPPADLHTVVSHLVPNANIWVADDDAYPPPTASNGKNLALEDALKWAAKNQDRAQKEAGDGTKCGNLVVLAGSLYLVADFYRLLEAEKKQEQV